MYTEHWMWDKCVEAHFENALDDIYYGYGYEFWRSHYDCDKDLTEEQAKLVWKVAVWVKTDEYCEGLEDSFPTFITAYAWMKEGVPQLSPDTAVWAYSEYEDIVRNYELEAVDIDIDEDYVAVKLLEKHSQTYFWYNVWLEERWHDVRGEWNQDIFSLLDPYDVIRLLLQDDEDFANDADSLATCYAEDHGVFHQWSDGRWYKEPETEIATENK